MAYEKNVNIKVNTTFDKDGSITDAVESLNDLNTNVDSIKDDLSDLGEQFDESIDGDQIQNAANEIDDITIKTQLHPEVGDKNTDAVKASAVNKVREIEDDIRGIQLQLGGSLNKSRANLTEPQANQKVEKLEDKIQNIGLKIGGVVKWGNGGSNWAAAQGSYNTKIEAWEKSASLKEIEPKIAGNVDFSGLQDFEIPDGVSEDLDQMQQVLTSIRDINEANEEALRSAQELRKGKEELKQEQKEYQEQTKETDEEQRREAETFAQAMGEAEGLAEAKDAASQANKMLSKRSEETTVNTLKEKVSFIESEEAARDLGQELGIVAQENQKVSDSAGDGAENIKDEAVSFADAKSDAEGLAAAKEKASKANKILSERSRETTLETLKEKASFVDTDEEAQQLAEDLDILGEQQQELTQAEKDSAEAADIETRSFEEMLEGADNLAEAKHAVSNANKKIQNESGKSTKELLKESDAVDETKLNMDQFADSNDRLSDKTRSLTRSISRMADETDESSASLRAAAEVGDLFEDGLGSLSVNLGAFTIALRNFLTQVPLLLTALGALGSAALAAASSFGVLAVATAGLFGAGLLANAQQLKSEFGQIEELGQALQVIMQNLFDTFEQAIQPLMQISGIMSYFTEIVEETAGVVYMLSDAIAQLTEGSDQLEDLAGGAENLYTIQDALDDIDGSSFQAVISSLMEAWVLLGEEVTWALGAINRALADAIDRSAELLAEVNNVSSAFSQFSDTISELAELGFTLGSGLLPIFESFSSIVEQAAAGLNELDDEMVAAGVTFAALMAASSKVAGTLSSVVQVFPSLITGFATIKSDAIEAGDGLDTFKKSVEGVSANVASFSKQIGVMGGFGELVDASSETGAAFREMAFNTSEATARFEALAVNSPETADELKSLASQGKLTQQDLDALKETSEELGDSLGVRLKSTLDEDQFEGVDTDDILENIDSDEEVSIGDIFETDDDGNILASQFDDLDNSVEDSNASLLESVKTVFGFGDAAEEAAEGADDIADSTFGMMGPMQAISKIDVGGDDMFDSSIVSVKEFTEHNETAFDSVENLQKAASKRPNFDLQDGIISTQQLSDTVDNSTESLYQNAIASNEAAMSSKKASLSQRGYIASLNSAIGTILAAIPAKLGLIETSRQEATATGLASKAIMKYLGFLNAKIGAMMAAVITNSTLIASTLGLAGAELTAATATQILKKSLNSLTGGLYTVIIGIVALIVTIGALAVGVMKNMEEVKGGFTSTLSVLGTVIGAVSDLLMTVFVATWEALKMTIMPLLRPFKTIAMAFQSTGDAASDSSAMVRILTGAFDLLLSVVSGAIRVLGLLGKGFTTLLILPLELVAFVIAAVIDGLQYLSQVAGSAITEIAKMFGLLQGQDSGSTGFLDLVAIAIERIADAVQNAGHVVEDIINSSIEKINEFIRGANNISGVNISEISRVDLTRDEAASTDQADVEPKKSNQITYNEDNSTNIDQTVDADPEDKAQLSRVVSDAIAQANSFERRRQGGQ